MWKKFQKFPPCELQDISVRSDKSRINPFFGPSKIQAAALHKFILVLKMSKMVVTLWIHSSKKVGYMLENFQIIWNCPTYRKKIVSRKK